MFTPARLAAARASGRAVFVNYTAAWCVTCIVNERRVLAAAWFRPAMAKAGIVYMKGDWTNRDAEIARALERFGRPGVPLYVVYRPGEAPRVLPQVLTPDILLGAIEN